MCPMPFRGRHLLLAVLAPAALAAGGCGSSSKPSTASSSPPPASTPAPAAASGGGVAAGGGSALAPDAKSAATGDIPDNQNFLTFRDAKAGFSIRYPEGWTQSGSANRVVFRDKNNLVRVSIASGKPPTVASVAAELAKLKASAPSLKAGTPQAVRIKGKPFVKVRYTTQSVPNAVTGKRVVLGVDRYETAKGGRVATVELGTPVGVDNVDAYRMMIGSFTWR